MKKERKTVLSRENLVMIIDEEVNLFIVVTIETKLHTKMQEQFFSQVYSLTQKLNKSDKLTLTDLNLKKFK